MKRKYQQFDNDEIEIDKFDNVDLNKINEYITKWFNEQNIKIIDI